MGKYNEALELYNHVCEVRTDILGINHPSTLSAKNNIAACLNDLGKYNEALQILYRLEKIDIDLLRADHLRTLTTKANIANCLKECESIMKP